ncbi:hypothetical protein PO909_000684, partial [Leuciscus waleckii]
YLGLCLLIALRASVEAKPVGSNKCGVCPAKWSANGCRCFRFFNNAHTWIDAEKICFHHDGNLASVHSLGEYTFIQRLVKIKTNTGTRAWIGGHDAVHEGVWLWSDGSQMNYQVWSSREPSNNRGKEHCLEMNYGNGNWNDDRCYEKKPFVCAYRLCTPAKEKSM